MTHPKPEVMTDVNKGIRELLAGHKIENEEQLSRIIADCCFQACKCCLQITISRGIDEQMKKVVNPNKFDFN